MAVMDHAQPQKEYEEKREARGNLEEDHFRGIRKSHRLENTHENMPSQCPSASKPKSMNHSPS
jgi:hypothetical protein